MSDKPAPDTTADSRTQEGKVTVAAEITHGAPICPACGDEDGHPGDCVVGQLMGKLASMTGLLRVGLELSEAPGEQGDPERWLTWATMVRRALNLPATPDNPRPDQTLAAQAVDLVEQLANAKAVFDAVYRGTRKDDGETYALLWIKDVKRWRGMGIFKDRQDAMAYIEAHFKGGGSWWVGDAEGARARLTAENPEPPDELPREKR